MLRKIIKGWTRMCGLEAGKCERALGTARNQSFGSSERPRANVSHWPLPALAHSTLTNIYSAAPHAIILPATYLDVFIPCPIYNIFSIVTRDCRVGQHGVTDIRPSVAAD
ncbi:hypothetical protein FRC08_009510 [Ceratobasidium sp. 394]|nr:hypothetical protein FRC08_009510 [Ceratobasidium sp. 394]